MIVWNMLILYFDIEPDCLKCVDIVFSKIVHVNYRPNTLPSQVLQRCRDDDGNCNVGVRNPSWVSISYFQSRIQRNINPNTPEPQNSMIDI